MKAAPIAIGLGVSLATFAAAHPAQATVTWQRDTTLSGITSPGCAVAIAVGPQNSPAVLGCDTNGSGDHSIWYLNWTVNGFNTTYQWTQWHPGSTASFIAVDNEGMDWVVNSSGNLYAQFENGGSPAWDNITNNNAQLIGVPQQGIGGCATAFVVVNSDTGGVENPPQWNIWDVGCGSATNREIWNYNIGTFPQKWVAPQGGQASASRLATFTLSKAGGGYNFNIWSLAFANNTSYLWQYIANTDSFLQMPNIDAYGAWWLTDHFAIGWSGVAEWNDTDPTHGTWTTGYAPASVNNNGNSAFITQIAYASPNAWGPGSFLWGIDQLGGIWYAKIQTPPT